MILSEGSTMADRSRTHQEAFGNEGREQTEMCRELKAAIESEGSARREYEDLEMAAKNNDKEFLAETVNQIETQEASHQSIFQKAHDMYCKD